MASETEQQLARKVNPTILTPQELKKKFANGNAFTTRVLGQPRLLLIDSDDDLPKPRQSRQGKTAKA